MKPLFKLPLRPALPIPFAVPLQLIPSALHSTALATALNVLIAQRVQDSGELDFLRGQVLAIRVRDAKIEYKFRYTNTGSFLPCPRNEPAALTISGMLYDFLALASRHEDSDTLFFKRRVIMEGDTALGLELKNWLDAMDPEALEQPIPSLLQAAQRCLTTYERLAGADEAALA